MKLFFLTIFLCATSYSYAQINRAFASNHEPKVAISPVFQNQKFSAFGLDSIAKPPGLRMKKTGVGLTLGGPLVIIAGIILVTSANSLDAYSTQDDIGIVLRQFGGTIFIIGGTGMTITGIVLWSIGGKKHKAYLEQKSVATTLQWKGRALSLTYRF